MIELLDRGSPRTDFDYLPISVRANIAQFYARYIHPRFRKCLRFSIENTCAVILNRDLRNFFSFIRGFTRSFSHTYLNLQGANLQRADLSKADLRTVNLGKANLQYANLQNANLWGSNLSFANLKSINLSHADLTCANLSNANLQSGSLDYAILNSANFQQANLTCANCRATKCIKTNFSGANLTHADFLCIENGQEVKRDDGMWDVMGGYHGGEVIYGPHYDYSDLNEANLDGAIVTETKFLQGDLRQTVGTPIGTPIISII
jgi:uncharacterized protein YjbI with pentapeptide repeats